MSSVMIGVIGLGLSLVLIFTGMPVGLSLILIGFAGISYLASVGAAGSSIATAIADVTGRYMFTVVPLFVLMGEIATSARISERAYEAAGKWVGNIKGGLAMATIMGCAAFADLSGSSVATAATMCKVAYPQMEKRGYKPSLSAGAIATGGTLGILIPPSMAFVTFAIITETSIGKLFMAGIIPGIFHTLLYMTVIFIWTRRDPEVGPSIMTRISLKEKISSLKGVVEVILIFALVMGGLYLGIFTPTEAGAIGAAGVLLTALSRGSLGWKPFKDALRNTITTTAMVVMLLAGAYCMSRFVALSGVALALASFVAGLPLPPLATLCIILITYILLGCIVETLVMIVVTLPVYFPLILALGFDPIWFGVLVVVVMEVALITPPVGLNVWIISGMLPEISMEKIFKGVLIFMIADLTLVCLLIAFPQITLFLPGTMG